MEYVLICHSLFVRINHSAELSVVNCTWNKSQFLMTPRDHQCIQDFL